MREQRKVVTVLFCDLVGSTALGESTDPEALRARMRRYFADLRTILERHGGTVEKFVGDAVMAVFGIPVAHEDDALRAVRAASAMREAVAGHGLEARIGLNTGEVVVGGESETLVTGDAVNVAARLEQAAGPGEVLLGAETRALVRDAIRVDAIEPLVLKGKASSVPAFRLVELLDDAAPIARHPEAPLVGRDRERRRLWRDYEDAVEDRTCRLFTLLGPAGIGKSRLVADFLERVGASADVHRGRCLSYGEGITYWPLVEILTAAGVPLDDVIGTSPPDTRLAFRRLLETRAAERPQVVVVDDLQWAEPVFVDLVEHVADLSRDAPIFLLCIARTELLDVRPDWGGGKVNATSLLLEPLDETECGELIGNLISDGALPSGLRERITAASAGNPLYVEEMLAMVRDTGDADVAVPPTIQALLQARIDSLEGDVRVVMERGAVEGEVFHRGAVAELAPEPVRPSIENHLTTLVRKELIRSTASVFPEDEGFRFRHLLIRDAAYESLPKSTRAELHERFAEWLAGQQLVERDEIVGYHLEQAHRYRRELDPGDPQLAGLAARSSSHLGSAGEAALDRGDFNAGRALLGRAVDLLAEGDERRRPLIPTYTEALLEAGEADRARTLLDDALESSEPRTRAAALLVESYGLTFFGIDQEMSLRRAEEARVIFEHAGDDYGLARYWWRVAWVSWGEVRAGDTADACERALQHLARTDYYGGHLDAAIRFRLIASYPYAPLHVDEALARVRAVSELGTGALFETRSGAVIGRLQSLKGDFESSRELVQRDMEALREAGLLVLAGAMSMSVAWVEWRAGNDDAAERALRGGIAVLESLGERTFLPTVALTLAQIALDGGRPDEARELCARARATSHPDDIVNFVYLDAIEGALLAREGEFSTAEALARRAVERMRDRDFFDTRALAHRYLAEVLALGGKTAEAEKEAAEALAVHDAKGDATGAARTRELLERADIAFG